MKTEVFGTALIAIIAGMYLGLVKIATMIAIALVIIGYAGKSKKTKSKVKKPSQNTAEETVLHPVVYEDAGEPPNLYPEDGSIKIYPDGKEEKLTAQDMAKSTEAITKATVKGIKKLID